MLPVASRIVNDVSSVMWLNHDIHFAWQAQYSVCWWRILRSGCSYGVLLCLPVFDLLEAPVVVDFFVGRFCWKYHGLGRVRGFFIVFACRRLVLYGCFWCCCGLCW